MLPTRYESPDLQAAPSGGSGGPLPAPIQTAARPRPIPLARDSTHAPSGLSSLPGGRASSAINAVTSLGIVLGLFIVVVWAVRRGTPKGAGLLPSDAVEVLGRALLAGRQQVHLVRCGNKIVLLAITPHGVQSLAEISDPAEVDRLYGVCQPAGPPAGSWREFFGLASPSRSSDYYASDDGAPIDFGHLETTGHRRA